MTATSSYLETSEEVLPVHVEPAEDKRAKASLEQYLALLGFAEPERARVAEQVMRRIEGRGHTDRLTRAVILELHRVLAGSMQLQPGGDSELTVLLRSIHWRAATWMGFFGEAEEKLLTNLGENGSTRFSAVPPIERRPMVPAQIEYISWRRMPRSFVAWLLGKRARAQFSLGQIPGE
jgi:hypothetical protein